MPFPPPRKIKSPIFERNPVPYGRLEDVYRALPADVRPLVAAKPAGKGYDAGFWIYKFVSKECLMEELLRDGMRCPAAMGGGTKGYGTAQVGWTYLADYFH